MPTNVQASILDILGERKQLLIEYGQLTSLSRLTRVQEQRLQEILEFSCQDAVLSFWIGEIDHIVGHEIGLLSPDCRRDYDNKRVLLKEYLLDFSENSVVKYASGEIRKFLEDYLEANTGEKSPLNLQDRPHDTGYRYSTDEVDGSNQLSGRCTE